MKACERECRLSPDPTDAVAKHCKQSSAVGHQPAAHGHSNATTEILAHPSRPAWAALDGRTFDGYEIRHGRIEGAGLVGAATWARGPVLATAVHGMFENPGVLGALFGAEPTATLDDTFDRLADLVDDHLDTDLIRSMVGLD